MRYLNLDLEVLEPWPHLNPGQLFIFAYVKDLCESKSEKVAERRLRSDPTFTWVDLGAMAKDVPHLGLRYTALREALQGLVSSGLLERKTENIRRARRSYFRVCKAYYDGKDALDLADLPVDTFEDAPDTFDDSPLDTFEDAPIQQSRQSDLVENGDPTEPPKRPLEGRPGDQDSILKTLEEGGGENALASSAAPAAAPSSEPSPSPSLPLIPRLREEAAERGINTSFLTPKWIDALGALTAKAGVSESSIVRAFCFACDSRPEKLAFFPVDFPRYSRELPAAPAAPRGPDPALEEEVQHREEVAAHMGDPAVKESIKQLCADLPWRVATRAAAANAHSSQRVTARTA